MDHDTPAVFRETAEMAVDIGIDLPRFAIVTPFPGTSLYRQLDQQGRLLTRDWSLYDGQHVVFQPAQLEVDELLYGNEAAWKYVYSWRNIASRLRRTAAPWYVAMTTNLGYRYYAHRLAQFYTCDSMSTANPLHSLLPTSPVAPADVVSIGGDS
jgi:radical SAM superfamily enzyme YgiQ (UPF0313 family)